KMKKNSNKRGGRKGRIVNSCPSAPIESSAVGASHDVSIPIQIQSVTNVKGVGLEVVLQNKDDGDGDSSSHSHVSCSLP
ncbi:hypothetical protein A2U01_0095494, partial [Trifolium medium]|nr:hypothetical protein [Trifolium medium]